MRNTKEINPIEEVVSTPQKETKMIINNRFKASTNDMSRMKAHQQNKSLSKSRSSSLSDENELLTAKKHHLQNTAIRFGMGT